MLPHLIHRTKHQPEFVQNFQLPLHHYDKLCPKAFRRQLLSTAYQIFSQCLIINTVLPLVTITFYEKPSTNLNYNVYGYIGNTSSRSPLDLRTSPVIRRSSTLGVRSKSQKEEVVFTAQKNKKLTFGSCSSEYSLDTVYETCKSREEIPHQSSATTAADETSEGIVSAEVYIETEVFQTPKSTGSGLKKTASFADNINACNDDDTDEWFTPSGPLHRSYSYTETKVRNMHI